MPIPDIEIPNQKEYLLDLLERVERLESRFQPPPESKGTEEDICPSCGWDFKAASAEAKQEKELERKIDSILTLLGMDNRRDSFAYCQLLELVALARSSKKQ